MLMPRCMGIGGNIKLIIMWLYMYFKYNSYILEHHNVKVCSCRQAE